MNKTFNTKMKDPWSFYHYVPLHVKKQDHSLSHKWSVVCISVTDKEATLPIETFLTLRILE